MWSIIHLEHKMALGIKQHSNDFRLAKITSLAVISYCRASKLDGSIPFLSEHLNMFFSPSCSHFWIWRMMLTKQCLTVCLKRTLSGCICLQVIPPEVRTSSLHARQKGHVFDLPR